MCIARPPDPKPAPAPPQQNDASLAAAEEQRRQAQGRSSAASNILTRLSDDEVADSARQKQLGGIQGNKRLLGECGCYDALQW